MIFDSVAEFIDNKNLDVLNCDFSSIKSNIKNIWSGSVASSFDLSFNGFISAIDKVYDSLNTFNNILSNLALYKENKKKISELERQIEQEINNPSLKTTESYVENGVTKTVIKYVVDQELIDRLRNQINILLEENENLKENMTVSCNSITSSNIKSKNNTDISHRGYRVCGVRENSAEAFILAGENGFWGCETDVRFDSSGNLVCSHNAPMRGEQVTSFETYLDICKQYGMTAIIDLKYAKGVGPADADLSPAIIRMIEEKGMIDSCVLQTNNPTDIPYIRQTSSDARIWYLTDVTSQKNLDLIKQNGVECVNIQSGENNLYNINILKQNGVDVCVWNVQSESRKDKLLDSGATYIMSDNVLGITPYQSGEKDYNGIV